MGKGGQGGAQGRWGVQSCRLQAWELPMLGVGRPVAQAPILPEPEMGD